MHISKEPIDAVLAPATRLLWRTHDTVHLETGGRAVVVERLPKPVIDRLVSSAPGSPSRAAAIAADTGAALDGLAAGGHLWRRPDEPDDARLRPPSPRLTGELIALTTRHGDRAAAVLKRRRRCSVVVHGHPRVAAHLAAVLAAAGVGRVSCVARADIGTVRPQHSTPGGVLPGDEKLGLDLALGAALERAAPEVDTTPPPPDDRPDLTVLVLEGPIEQDLRAALHADRAAHLAVATTPDGGVVGPLVVPGITGCLACADLHRSDRDPAWPVLAAQLTVPRRHGTSCDVATEAVISGVAAAQALAFLDGEDVACIDGTIEFHPPDWRLRRRTWPVHPSCLCGHTGETDPTSARSADGHWAQ